MSEGAYLNWSKVGEDPGEDKKAESMTIFVTSIKFLSILTTDEYIDGQSNWNPEKDC